VERPGERSEELSGKMMPRKLERVENLGAETQREK